MTLAQPYLESLISQENLKLLAAKLSLFFNFADYLLNENQTTCLKRGVTLIYCYIRKRKQNKHFQLLISYLLFPNILLWLGIAIWKNRDLTKTPNGKPGFMKSLLTPKNFTGEFGKVTKRWGHQLMNNPSRWYPLHNKQVHEKLKKTRTVSESYHLPNSRPISNNSSLKVMPTIPQSNVCDNYSATTT